MALVLKNVEDARGVRHQVLDVEASVRNLAKLKGVGGSNSKPIVISDNTEEIKLLQEASRNQRELLEKVKAENRTLHQNMLKLLKRVEKLEKDNSSSGSIADF